MNTIELDHRRSLLLEDIRGTTLRITRGQVWITQEGDSRDIVLGPGEAWTVDRDGLTIVEAQGDTTLLACDTHVERAKLRAAPVRRRRTFWRALRAQAARWLSLRPRQPLPYL
jgi:hypothetical protein